MALTLRTGTDAIKKAAERSGSSQFMPTMKWEAGQTRYVQFIQNIEDIPTVKMHPLLVVGLRDDGNKRYDTFISRRDENIDGPDGYDGFADKFGEVPKDRNIALVVELEPVGGLKGDATEWDIVEREYTKKDSDEKITVPNVQLIIQSPSTFGNNLAVIHEMKNLNGKVVGITRTGKSTDTTYTVTDLGGEALSAEELVEVLALVEFDFDEYLESLADEDRQREIVDSLPSDFVVNQYTKRKTAVKPAAGAATPSRRRAAAATPQDTDEPAAAPAAEEPVDESPGARRSRRFSKLRDEADAAKPTEAAAA